MADNHSIYDAAIIGGGAAGLSAAVSYIRRKPRRRLLLIEANDILGKKLLATGNGRCNISNLSAERYGKIKEFFGSIGVLFRVEDGGRAYPMSGQAASVRDALVCALQLGDAELRYGSRVSRVERGSDIGDGLGFTICFEDGESVQSARLLIATGGKAGPQYGCYGDGYAFARGFGHSVESIRPALVPLIYVESERERLSCLKGVRIRALAKLLVGGKMVSSSSGELQFTEYGLSGIMVFDISAMMPKSIIEGRPRVEVALDLAPGEQAEMLERLILENEGLWLEGVVGKKISDLLVQESRADVAKSVALAKHFVVSVGGTKGWKEAQTTIGGIRLAEVNEQSGESLLCKGLFFAGEILEPVFICGGYNLHYAWETGLRAGNHL